MRCENSKLREVTSEKSPSVRDSSPGEVAGLVSYLVSAEAAMITGQSVRLFAFLLPTLSNCFPNVFGTSRFRSTEECTSIDVHHEITLT